MENNYNQKIRYHCMTHPQVEYYGGGQHIYNIIELFKMN